MERQLEVELRTTLEWELGSHRSNAPGLLAAWRSPRDARTVQLKEVLAIIRPERWGPTKARLQRLRLPACTQARVLGRGRGRGLRYPHRQGAGQSTGIRYLPKRLISWIVEDHQVEALVQAILEVNQRGQVGDGKMFVLPVEEAIRIRTSERGCDALRAQHPFTQVRGTSIEEAGATPAGNRDGSEAKGNAPSLETTPYGETHRIIMTTEVAG